VEDKELANALADLLALGVGLGQAQIFCSSLAGMGIPAGKSFKDYIGEELAGAPVVIALLTPNYYSSAFCLCETGATWILSKDFIPLLTPATKFSDMKAVLEGTQALRIEEETALDEVREHLEPYALKKTKDAWWTVKKKEFLEELPSILGKLPKPKLPTAEDHKVQSVASARNRRSYRKRRRSVAAFTGQTTAESSGVSEMFRW